MERLNIAETDLDVSTICLGTADWGTATSVEQAHALLHAFRDAGGNFLDTAHVYGAWALTGTAASERVIGNYIQKNGINDLVVATKGGHPNIGHYRSTDAWLAPYRLRADIDDSLARLGLETIDLYYLHRDDLAMDVSEIIGYLNEEVERGRIRYLGCSNWTVERIQAANEYAREQRLQGFVISEIQWSLAHKEPPDPRPRGTQTVYARECEAAYQRRTGMALAAYTATARGYFSLAEGGRGGFDNPTSRRRRERARELAEKKHATPTQIALAWLMHQDFPCFPITGTTSLEHLRENLQAVEIELHADERDWLANG